MTKFHQELTEIKVQTCTVCNETFPAMKINKNLECSRCVSDKQTPKLYSADNDIHPGEVPAELKVGYLNHAMSRNNVIHLYVEFDTN